MVNYQPHCLDGIFAALADPTRRAMLTRSSTAPELSVTALARPFAMSLPAVLKHLDVLEGAGLILRHKRGLGTVSCRLSAAPLREAQRWLADYEQFWCAAARCPRTLSCQRGRARACTGRTRWEPGIARAARVRGFGQPADDRRDNACSPEPGPDPVPPAVRPAADDRPSLAITATRWAPPQSFCAWTAPKTLKQGERGGDAVLRESH